MVQSNVHLHFLISNNDKRLPFRQYLQYRLNRQLSLRSAFVLSYNVPMVSDDPLDRRPNRTCNLHQPTLQWVELSRANHELKMKVFFLVESQHRSDEWPIWSFYQTRQLDKLSFNENFSLNTTVVSVPTFHRKNLLSSTSTVPYTELIVTVKWK